MIVTGQYTEQNRGADKEVYTGTQHRDQRVSVVRRESKVRIHRFSVRRRTCVNGDIYNHRTRNMHGLIDIAGKERAGEGETREITLR